jgi:hypothetical protein
MRVGEKAEGWMAKSSTSLVVKIDLIGKRDTA